MTGKIELKNVNLTYPSRPTRQILNGLNVVIEPGKVTALVGPSGGGKSSTISLIENFYQPDEGEVLIDGVRVNDYDHKYLHKNVSLVGQEPVLFARSIEENIQYGVDDSTGHPEIQSAAKKANAHRFITEMVDGYATFCGEKGAQMSGGQKQRIAIARSLVRDPRILLLDEATSALDTESEYLVQQALEKNLSDRTVLVIAHRLSTVERADKIYVISKGRAIEQGTHAELMSRPDSFYKKLVQRQLMPEANARAERCSDDDGKPVEDQFTKSYSERDRYIPIATNVESDGQIHSNMKQTLGSLAHATSYQLAAESNQRRGTYGNPPAYDEQLARLQQRKDDELE